MDLNRGDGRRLVWVGEPNVGTGNVQQASRSATRWRRRRREAPLGDLRRRGGSGRRSRRGFAEFITLPDGSTARCYAGDGVHLSVRCLERVMDELVPTVTDLYAG
jgi:hypothetical protein